MVAVPAARAGNPFMLGTMIRGLTFFLSWQAPVQAYGRNVMKSLLSMLALALAMAVTGPAFAAGDVTKATTKADCDKAGGSWDDTKKMCSEKKM